MKSLMVVAAAASERITVERSVGKLPALSRLSDYAAVVMGCGSSSFGKDGLRDWTSEAGLAALEKYVREGGNVIVLSGLGGEFVKSVAVRNPVGQGSFYWLSQSWSQYDLKFAAKHKVAGEADDKGIFVLTPDGEAQKSLNDFFKGLLLGLAKIDTSAPPSTWGLKPLGEPGNLKLDTTFAHEPVFKKAPVRKPGIRFATTGPRKPPRAMRRSSRVSPTSGAVLTPAASRRNLARRGTPRAATA